jgi:hypothetical protein
MVKLAQAVGISVGGCVATFCYLLLWFAIQWVGSSCSEAPAQVRTANEVRAERCAGTAGLPPSETTATLRRVCDSTEGLAAVAAAYAECSQ